MNEQLALAYSYLHGIWSYRWSALVISWVLAILGWIVVYSLPDLYTSTAVMHIDTRSTLQPLLKGLAVETSVDRELGTLKRRLLSENNLIKIVERTDLNSMATSDEAMSRLTKDLAAKFSFEKVSGSGKKKGSEAIYQLSLEGRSPELVQQIVAKALNTLINSTLKAARTDTAAAQEFLNTQIIDYELRLSTAEQTLAEFTRANIGLMPDESGGYYKKLQREQEALQNMRSDLRSEEKRLSEMRKQLKGELPVHSGQQLAKIRNYREKVQDLLTQYTESHPDVQALRTLIAESLAEKQSESTYLDAEDAEFNPAYQELKIETRNVGIEVEAMKAKIFEQEAKVEAFQLSVDLVPEVEAQLAKLNRDYNLTKQRHLKLVESREQARLAEIVGETGNNVDFKILSMPSVAGSPSGPNRLLLVSLVFVVALGAGLAWGFLKYAMQPTFVYLRQLDSYIDIPILGTVGLYMTDKHKKERRVKLTSFLLVFSLLIITYAAIMYIELGLTMDDILKNFQSSEI